MIAFGTARLVEETQEKEFALQGLLDKYFPELQPGDDYAPIAKKEMEITAVYAIEIDGWSGKEKVAD